MGKHNKPVEHTMRLTDGRIVQVPCHIFNSELKDSVFTPIEVKRRRVRFIVPEESETPRKEFKIKIIKFVPKPKPEPPPAIPTLIYPAKNKIYDPRGDRTHHFNPRWNRSIMNEEKVHPYYYPKLEAQAVWFGLFTFENLKYDSIQDLQRMVKKEIMSYLGVNPLGVSSGDLLFDPR